MSIPPPPKDLPAAPHVRVANAYHSLSIHLLRRARMADRDSGLTPERLSLLSVLVYAGAQTIGALAAMEGVSAPAISRNVSALERLGLARRKRGADAREVMVECTARARRLVEAGRRRRIAMIAELFAGLDRKEIAALESAATILASCVAPPPSEREKDVV